MKFGRITVLLVIFVGTAALATAQDTSAPARGNIGLFGSYAASAADGLDKGHGGGVSGTFFFSELLGIEGGYRRLPFDVVATDENAITGGTMSSNVITLNVVVRGAAGAMQPYGSAGVAFVANSYTIDPNTQLNLDPANLIAAETVDSTVGFNFAAGVDFVAGERFGFFFEGRYIAATTDTSGGLRDPISGVERVATGSQDINAFIVAGGIRIFF